MIGLRLEPKTIHTLFYSLLPRALLNENKKEITTTTSGLTEERVPLYRLEVDSTAGNHPRDLTDPERERRAPENVVKEEVGADLGIGEKAQEAPATEAAQDAALTDTPANLDHETRQDPRADDPTHPATEDAQVVEIAPDLNAPEGDPLAKDEARAAEAVVLTVRPLVLYLAPTLPKEPATGEKNVGSHMIKEVLGETVPQLPAALLLPHLPNLKGREAQNLLAERVRSHACSTPMAIVITETHASLATRRKLLLHRTGQDPNLRKSHLRLKCVFQHL
jgi:hypothetical protein